MERCCGRLVRHVRERRLEQRSRRFSNDLRNESPAELLLQQHRMDYLTADILHVCQCAYNGQDVRLVRPAMDHCDWKCDASPWGDDDVFVDAVLAFHLIAIDMYGYWRWGNLLRGFKQHRNMVQGQ